MPVFINREFVFISLEFVFMNMGSVFINRELVFIINMNSGFIHLYEIRAYCKRRTLQNETSGWSVSRWIQLSLLPCWPLLANKRSVGEATMQVNSVVRVSSGMGACTRIVGLFKHLFRVTAHPHAIFDG